MCSPYRLTSVACVMALAVAGCHREARQLETPQQTQSMPDPVAMSPLVGGIEAAEFRELQRRTYEKNAYHLAEGKRLYTWFNCVGCHSHGGGGSGPPLMDERWIYGAEIDQIYLSIVQGRPNGMPAFGGRIPPQQIWQIAAYVRSLSGFGPKAARPGRDDHMQVPSEQGRADEPTRPMQAPHAN
jgi:cytochrome c oxidase cbb3-type subunit 3